MCVSRSRVKRNSTDPSPMSTATTPESPADPRAGWQLTACRERVADDGLQARNEVKFVLPGADVGSLRKILEACGQRLAFGNNARADRSRVVVSTVRSVYFDDWTLSACRANLDGLGVRRKLRLRWYDRLLPARDLVLEIKWRRHRATGKHRLHLHSEQVLDEFSFGEMRAELLRLAPVEFLESLWQAAEPVVLVEYQREHFASPSGDIRMTLDHGLVFYDQFSKNELSVRFPRRLAELAIVEVKGPIGAELELRAALGPFAARVGGFSKYVAGCQLFGLVPSPDRQS